MTAQYVSRIWRSTTVMGELEEVVKKGDINTKLHESIIDMETVLGAIAQVKRRKPHGRRGPLDLLEGEPALHEFLKGALLEVAGNMAIDGCPPMVVRSVYREAGWLLAVTYNAVRQAHRDLYADLLPQTDDGPAPADPHADQNLAPAPERKGRPDSSSKRREPGP